MFTLSPKAKYELHSALNTIVSALTVELGIQASLHHELMDPTMLSKQVVFSVGLALVRSAWKAGFTFILSRFNIEPPKAV